MVYSSCHLSLAHLHIHTQLPLNGLFLLNKWMCQGRSVYITLGNKMQRPSCVQGLTFNFLNQLRKHLGLRVQHTPPSLIFYFVGTGSSSIWGFNGEILISAAATLCWADKRGPLANENTSHLERRENWDNTKVVRVAETQRIKRDSSHHA